MSFLSDRIGPGQTEKVIVGSLEEIPNPEDGQTVVYKNGATQSVWWWDDSRRTWRLGTTFGEWFLLEDWSSGKIQSQTWSVVLGDAAPFQVNENKNRLELPFSSGDVKEAALNSNHLLDLSADIKAECSLGAGGQPGSGEYFIHVQMADMDDGGGAEVEDYFAAKLSASSSVYRTELVSDDWDSGGGFTVHSTAGINVADDHVMELHAGSPTGYQSATYSYMKCSVLGGALVDEVEADEPRDFRSGRPSLWIRSKNTDLSSTMWVGRIWVRR